MDGQKQSACKAVNLSSRVLTGQPRTSHNDKPHVRPFSGTDTVLGSYLLELRVNLTSQHKARLDALSFLLWAAVR